MKSSFLAAASVCLACQLLVPASMLNAAPQNSDATKSPAKKASTSKDDATQKLAREATNLLQQVSEASQAVTAKQTKTAMSHIDHALAIRSQLATLSKTAGQSMIVPLYTELDETSVLGPMLSTKKGKPQPSTSGPITVDDASAQYTFVGLDLDKTKSRLDAAKMALNDKNPQAASDSLAAIGTDLVVGTEEADLPLLAARENLGIAQTAVKNRKYQEANAALKEASIALDTYSNKNGAQHAGEAKELRTKVDSLSQAISKNHSGAEATIDGWWHEVDNWFTHMKHSS